MRSVWEDKRAGKEQMRNGQQKDAGRRTVLFLVSCVLICSSCIFALLSFWACRYSYYSQKDYSQPILLMKDSVWVHIALFAALCGAVKILDMLLRENLSDKTQEKVCLVVLILAGAWLLGAGTIYVWANPYYPQGDQLNTTASAYYCLEGNFSMLSPGGYIGLYQQQKGFMFLYEILFSVFGGFCYGVAERFHVLFGVLILISGYFLIKQYSGRAVLRILFCLFMAACFPLILFLPYIYGDIPAICFSMLLFWALSAYSKKFQKRYVFFGALAASLALLCRMNTWVILIAVGIGMVLAALEMKNYRPLAAAVCIILAAAGSVKVVDVMYEYRSGYESGTGIPSILWIAMGLQDTDGRAGVYNRYQQTVFEESGLDRDLAAQVGKDYIRLRLREFQQNPSMARNFFKRKVQGQWLEPLFESLYSTSTFAQEVPVRNWLKEIYYGQSHDTLWKSANYYQSIVYLGMLFFGVFGLRTVRRQKNIAVWCIPQIAVIGGFLFSLMWEAQCRYCLPYFIYMLLYVPEGMIQAGDAAGRLWNRIRRKPKAEERERRETAA